VGDLNADGRPDVVTANRDSNNISVLLNTPVRPPAVVSAKFDLNASQQQIAVKFDQNLQLSVGVSDLILQDLTRGTTIPTSSLYLNYDAPTNVAAFQFSGFPRGILPDGNYRATLPAGSVNDSLGNGLAADVTFDFFVLAGDANRDRIVDVADLGIVATNWHLANRDFSQGNFNYDRTVDFYDLGIIAERWQRRLPAAVAPVAAAVRSTAPTKTTSRSLLDDTGLSDPVT
jgi:hypothetical protein